jgi:hypothetical protein
MPRSTPGPLPRSFPALLSRALALVARDAPRCAAALADRVAGAAIAITIDGELAIVRATARGIVAEREPAAPVAAIEVTASSRDVLALLSGGDELYPAVRANRVRVRAAREHAARLFDVVRLLIEGCARSPDGPALLAEFRDLATEVAERN